MFTITTAGVNVDIHPKQPGILVSGGADSAILLYMLLKYCPTPVKVFTLCSADKQNVTKLTSTRVIDVCERLTGNTAASHVLKYVDSYNRQDFIGWINDLMVDDVDVMYSGNTRRPPDSVLSTFINSTNPTLLKRRDPNNPRPVYDPLNGKFYSPFDVIDKSVIRTMYQKLGVINTLFPVTWSCERMDGITTHHCGNCWWCEERMWAFGKLE